MITPGDKTGKNKWIYLSPHLDDAVLSCGGVIAHQTAKGETVSVWTLFAGNPPSEDYSSFALELHSRWKLAENPPAARRREDQAACSILGASAVHFTLPDCIYRRAGQNGAFLYPSEVSIFDQPHPLEAGMARRVAEMLNSRLPSEYHLVCPLAIGGHVDHRITKAAAQLLGLPILYYADFPYIAEERVIQETSPPLIPGTAWQVIDFTLSDEEVQIWGDGVAAYGSQISTFWPGEVEMRDSLNRYYRDGEKISLWRPLSP
jgi:LmbE family N-acetylglucosaminyl deacetylase